MNPRHGWFLLIGLMSCLLLGGGIYLLSSARKSIIVAPNSPTVVVKTPVSSPAPEGGLAAPTSDASPPLQPRVDSEPGPAYQYNAQGQLQTITYPDGSVYSYSYDAYGDKIRETNRTGKTWSYAYDQSHHPIAVIDPEGRVRRKDLGTPAP